jgi:hypothetical protein
MLDRVLHHGHVLKCGPRSLAHQNSADRSWRMRAVASLRPLASAYRMSGVLSALPLANNGAVPSPPVGRSLGGHHWPLFRWPLRIVLAIRAATLVQPDLVSVVSVWTRANGSPGAGGWPMNARLSTRS